MWQPEVERGQAVPVHTLRPKAEVTALIGPGLALAVGPVYAC